eukprot:c18320_g1_i1 orf=297-1685(+)
MGGNLQEERSCFVKNVAYQRSVCAPLVYVHSMSVRRKKRISSAKERSLEGMGCLRTGYFHRVEVNDMSERSEGSAICSVESGELVEMDHERHLNETSKYICEAATPKGHIEDRLQKNRSMKEGAREDASEVDGPRKEDFPVSVGWADSLASELGFNVHTVKQSKAKYCCSIFHDNLDCAYNITHCEMSDAVVCSCEPSRESLMDNHSSALVIRNARVPQRNGFTSNTVQKITGEIGLWEEGINLERIRQGKSSSQNDRESGPLQLVDVGEDQNIRPGDDDKTGLVLTRSDCNIQPRDRLIAAEGFEVRASRGHSNRPVVIDCSDKFKLQAPQGVKERPEETDPHRLSQRKRQIQFGKNTLGYQHYSHLIPRCKRQFTDPHTPDVKQACSKRSWGGQIRKWRRLLHVYDPPLEEGEEMPVELSQGTQNAYYVNKKECEQIPHETTQSHNLNSSIYGDWDEMEA